MICIDICIYIAPSEEKAHLPGHRMHEVRKKQRRSVKRSTGHTHTHTTADQRANPHGGINQIIEIWI